MIGLAVSNVHTFKISNFQTFKCWWSSTFQAFKLSNFAIFKHSNFQKFVTLSNVQTFKLPLYIYIYIFNFQTFKLSHFQTLKVWYFSSLHGLRSDLEHEPAAVSQWELGLPDLFHHKGGLVFLERSRLCKNCLDGFDTLCLESLELWRANLDLWGLLSDLQKVSPSEL